MNNSITQQIAGVEAASGKWVMLTMFQAIGDRLSSQSLTSAALVINAASSPLAKTGATYYGTAQGKLVTKPSATVMPALAGTVTNARFNVFCFFVDAAGVVTSAMGLESATLAGVTFPTPPQLKTMIGFIVINPTGTGNFVGGTTNLDDATVVPNAAFINTVGAFDPTILL